VPGGVTSVRSSADSAATAAALSENGGGAAAVAANARRAPGLRRRGSHGPYSSDVRYVSFPFYGPWGYYYPWYGWGFHYGYGYPYYNPGCIRVRTGSTDATATGTTPSPTIRSLTAITARAWTTAAADRAAARAATNTSRAWESLRFRVDPKDAQIYIDGALVGTVDEFDGLASHLEIEAGSHELRLKAPGYETYTATINVPASRTTTQRIKMKKQ
jgi:hypothetical protein